MSPQELWTWTRPSWLRREYALAAGHRELARVIFHCLRAAAGVSHRTFRIELDEALPDATRLQLAAFGGYLLAVTQDDAAAGAVVAAAG